MSLAANSSNKWPPNNKLPHLRLLRRPLYRKQPLFTLRLAGNRPGRLMFPPYSSTSNRAN